MGVPLRTGTGFIRFISKKSMRFCAASRTVSQGDFKKAYSLLDHGPACLSVSDLLTATVKASTISAADNKILNLLPNAELNLSCILANPGSIN